MLVIWNVIYIVPWLSQTIRKIKIKRIFEEDDTYHEWQLVQIAKFPQALFSEELYVLHVRYI